MPAQTENLVGVIEAVRARADAEPGEHITVAQVLDTAGLRSFGPMLAAIGLFAISPVTMIPGMTWLAAALTLLVAGQMALGFERSWLPRRVLEARVPAHKLADGLAKAEPWAARVDHVLRPRLTWLAKPPFANLIGLICIVAALVTIPLSFVPMAPLAPSIAILFFGLGIAAKDGLVLALGTALVGGTFAVLSRLIF